MFEDDTGGVTGAFRSSQLQTGMSWTFNATLDPPTIIKPGGALKHLFQAFFGTAALDHSQLPGITLYSILFQASLLMEKSGQSSP